MIYKTPICNIQLCEKKMQQTSLSVNLKYCRSTVNGFGWVSAYYEVSRSWRWSCSSGCRMETCRCRACRSWPLWRAVHHTRSHRDTHKCTGQMELSSAPCCRMRKDIKKSEYKMWDSDVYKVNKQLSLRFSTVKRGYHSLMTTSGVQSSFLGIVIHAEPHCSGSHSTNSFLHVCKQCEHFISWLSWFPILSIVIKIFPKWQKKPQKTQTY